MGKQNRRRRTGRRPGPRPGGTAAAWAGVDEPLDVGAVVNAVMAAAMRSANGASATGKRFATAIAGRSTLTPELAHGAHQAGQHVIELIFQNGWQPGDIHQVARQRVDEFASLYLLDAMAAYVHPFAPDTVDEAWRRQLDQFGATVWWSGSEPHLGQWAIKHLLTPVEALTTVVEALAMLVALPKLELIRPLPGTARPLSTQYAVDDKVLSKVRALLAKAESTSYPEEAETLSAKAQELMTKYAIDRVLIDTDTGVPDLPSARRIWLETPYTDAKALLVDVVAQANRCRAIFASTFGFITLVGDEPDLDVVELLTTSLLIQATRAMIARGNKPGHDTAARSRTFRKSFLVAYATRIGERLDQASETTIAEFHEAQRLLPVLASHQLKVDETFDKLFPRARNRGITIRSAAGWDAGRSAADRAQLE